MIEKNELLKIFESKNKMIKYIQNKIETQLNKIRIKLFPNYMEHFSVFEGEKVKRIEFLQILIYFINYFLNNKNSQKLNISDRLNKIFQEIFKKFVINISSTRYFDSILTKNPEEILDYFMKQIKNDELFHNTFVEELIININSAIDDLDKIRNTLEGHYILDKLWQKIKTLLKNKKDEILPNDLTELKQIYIELLNKHKDPLDKFKLKEQLDSIRKDFFDKKSVKIFSNIEEILINNKKN